MYAALVQKDLFPFEEFDGTRGGKLYPTFCLARRSARDPMATFYIPTDYSGGTIQVNEGDVFIFEAGANSKVTFESASGSATNFDIEFNSSNSNNFDVVVEYDLTPSIVIADNVDLEKIFLKTQHADEVELLIGDNVTLQKYEGSDIETDTVVIGDNFTTTNDFKTGKGDDHLTIGENATVPGRSHLTGPS